MRRFKENEKRIGSRAFLGLGAPKPNSSDLLSNAALVIEITQPITPPSTSVALRKSFPLQDQMFFLTRTYN